MRASTSTTTTSLSIALVVLTSCLALAPAARAETVLQMDVRAEPHIVDWQSVFTVAGDDDGGLRPVAQVAVRPFGCTTTTEFVAWLDNECTGDRELLICEKTTCNSWRLIAPTVTWSEDCFYCIDHPECCGIELPDPGDFEEEGLFPTVDNNSARISPSGVPSLAFAYGIDSNDALLPDVTGEIEIDAERTVHCAFRRPDGVDGAAELVLPIVVDRLAVAGLFAEDVTSLRWELVVESPQLGVLFSSTIDHVEGGDVEVGGDIAPELFSGDAGLVRTQNYRNRLSTVVPAELDRVDLTARFRFTARATVEESSDSVPSGDEPTFRRGDGNHDGRIEVADAIDTLRFLFRGGAAPVCQDAADSNDNGVIELADAIHELRWLFLGATEPAAPGPHACGVDPTADDLAECVENPDACPARS